MVFLEDGPLLRRTDGLSIFQNSYLPLPLPETWGRFSQIFTLRSFSWWPTMPKTFIIWLFTEKKKKKSNPCSPSLFPYFPPGGKTSEGVRSPKNGSSEIPFLKLVYTQTPTTSQLPLRFSYQLLVPVAVSALGSSGSLDLPFLRFSGW